MLTSVDLDKLMNHIRQEKDNLKVIDREFVNIIKNTDSVIQNVRSAYGESYVVSRCNEINSITNQIRSEYKKISEDTIARIKNLENVHKLYINNEKEVAKFVAVPSIAGGYINNPSAIGSDYLESINNISDVVTENIANFMDNLSESAKMFFSEHINTVATKDAFSKLLDKLNLTSFYQDGVEIFEIISKVGENGIKSTFESIMDTDMYDFIADYTLLPSKDEVDRFMGRVNDGDILGGIWEGFKIYLNNAYDATFGKLEFLIDRIAETKYGNKILDGLQFILDICGMIPGYGIPFDLVNAAISYARGDTAGAIISLVCTLVDFGVVAKWVKKIPGVEKAIAFLVKEGGELLSKTIAKFMSSSIGKEIIEKMTKIGGSEIFEKFMSKIDDIASKFSEKFLNNPDNIFKELENFKDDFWKGIDNSIDKIFKETGEKASKEALEEVVEKSLKELNKKAIKELSAEEAKAIQKIFKELSEKMSPDDLKKLIDEIDFSNPKYIDELKKIADEFGIGVEGLVKRFSTGGAGSVSADIIEAGKKITNFDTPADPIRDILGSGLKSNPKEWNRIIKELEDSGVEVVYREGTMGYGPLRKGEPGQIVIDPDASLSALQHEQSHFIEAQSKGFPSAAESYQDWEARIADEFKAYTLEIEEAKRLGLDNVVEQLQKNFEAEKQYIIDRYGPIE